MNISWEIGIHPSRSTAIGCAHRNPPTIYIGCNIEGLNRLIQDEPQELLSCYKKYNTVEQLYEDRLEMLLTHETLHLVIRRLLGWGQETLDNVDKENEISGYGIAF